MQLSSIKYRTFALSITKQNQILSGINYYRINLFQDNTPPMPLFDAHLGVFFIYTNNINF